MPQSPPDPIVIQVKPSQESQANSQLPTLVHLGSPKKDWTYGWAVCAFVESADELTPTWLANDKNLLSELVEASEHLKTVSSNMSTNPVGWRCFLTSSLFSLQSACSNGELLGDE